MDFTKMILPDSVEVSGKFYQIHTGHPYWFRLSELLAGKLYVSDFDYLYISDRPEDKQAGIDKLMAFYYEKKELPKVEDNDSSEKILDYKIDSDMIYAAIMQCYHIDLFEKEIHWHKVRALISGLHDTKLNEIMQYRCCNPGKNKELARMKRIWSLPVIDNDGGEALKKFNEIFYK